MCKYFVVVADLKVEVHRKNSSESSDLSLGLAGFKATATSIQTHSADICQTSNHRRSFKTKSKSEEATSSQHQHHRSPISEEGGEYACGTTPAPHKTEQRKPDQFVDIEAVIRDKQKKKLRSKLQRQVSLDAEKIGIGHWSSSTTTDPHLANKLQRHRSTENTTEHRQRQTAQHFSGSSSHQQHLQSVPSDLYYIPDDEDAYLNHQQQTPMRKDSSSTMSALQLPTSSAASSSRVRRHSNATGKQGSMVTVRRIKSAALETCCAQPSVSNLVPHPSSVETIGGGQQLRNPQHAILPPPSKCLVRNAHLNLFPQPEAPSGHHITGIVASDSVYPIAELVDERVADSFHFESSESDEDDDEEDREDRVNTNREEEEEDEEDDEDEEEEGDDDDEDDLDQPRAKRQDRHSTTSDSDIDRPQTQSTDSDTENNGSRSPLLDLKSRSAYFIPKSNAVDKKPHPSTEKQRKGGGSNTATASIGGTSSATNGTHAADRPNTKSEDSGCPSSDCDQASASSKDMLLTTATSTASSMAKTSPTYPKLFFGGNQSVPEGMDTPGEGSSKDTSDGTTATTVKEVKVGRSLGAIPKQLMTRGCTPHGSSGIQRESDAYDGYVVMAKSKKTEHYPTEVPTYLDISRNSSWSSLSRRCSAGSGVDYPDVRSPVDVLHETKGGWTVRPATATHPATAASRGDPPPLLPTYSRRPYVCFPPALPPRQFQPKLRLSARSRNQSTSFDSSAGGGGAGTSSCTRDDETLARTIAAWEYGGGDGEVRDALGAGLMLQFELPSHHPSERGSREATSGANTSTGGVAGGSVPISLSGVDYGEAVFCDYWRHYNLPPEKLVAPKRFYKYPFKCFGRHEVKISMDRLQLLALLDRDLGWFHAGISIILSATVSVLGASVLRLGVYKDIFAFLFCFVMAGSQYSLLKSVQPDAASPIHGFNKTVAFSRPIYFCLCAGLLIFAHNLSVEATAVSTPLTIFSVTFVPTEFFGGVKYILSLVLLCLPVFFSLGLFPQINTFLMYVLEQVDMHMFGGSAVCSLLAATIGVLRSCFACVVLYGPCFGGLSERKGTQHVLFSSFCALLVAVSYHLSRNASDVSCIWTIIKSSLVLQTDDDESEQLKPIIHRTSSSISTEAKKLTEDESPNQSAPDVSKESLTASAPRLASTIRSNSSDSAKSPTANSEAAKDDPSSPELEDPLPRKLQNTVNSRLKNDFLVCLVIFGALLSLHCSTVFTVLQPELNNILRISVSVLGFLLHYVIPQMRKHLPWLWFAEPILRAGEHNQYEPHEATRVMWFEKCYVYACFVERNVLYPLLFVAALTSDSSTVSAKFGNYLGTAIVVVCGLKGVRSSYADPASQYLVVVFTVLLFLWDFKTASESFLVNYFVVAIVFKKFCEFLLKVRFLEFTVKNIYIVRYIFFDCSFCYNFF